MNDASRKTMGKRIRERRDALGLSQLELAQRVGKSSAAYIAFIESGERNITMVDLMVLAKELGTSVAELVGEEESSKKVPFKQALRNTGDLDSDDRKKMMEFYEFLRSKKNG